MSNLDLKDYTSVSHNAYSVVSTTPDMFNAAVVGVAVDVSEKMHDWGTMVCCFGHNAVNIGNFVVKLDETMAE